MAKPRRHGNDSMNRERRRASERAARDRRFATQDGAGAHAVTFAEEEAAVVDAALLEREVAVTGPKATQCRGLVALGNVKGVRDPSLGGDGPTFSDLQKMRWLDPVFSCVWIKGLLVQSHLGTYVHEKPEIKEFVEEVWSQFDGSLTSYVQEALRVAVWSGVAVTELVWKRLEGKQRGKWGIGKLKVLPPDSLYPTGFDVDRYGNVTEIVQYRGYDELETRIPVEKCARWCFLEESGNPYGGKVLRAAFRAATHKVFTEDTMLNFAERASIPALVGRIPEQYVGTTQTGPDGREYPVEEALVMWMSQIGRMSNVVCFTDPQDPGGKTIDTLFEASGGLDQFLGAVTYYDVSIARSMVTSLMLTTPSTYGTRAQSDTHSDVAKLDPETTTERIAQELLVDGILKSLIVANFGPQDDYGRYETKPFDVRDWQLVSLLVQNLTDSNWLSSKNPKSVEWLADYMGMPKDALGPAPADPMLVAQGFQTPGGEFIPAVSKDPGGGTAAAGGRVQPRADGKKSDDVNK